MEGLLAIGDVIAPTTCEDGVCYGSPPLAGPNGAFVRGGFLNSNQYLRIGVGSHKGGSLFRISGDLIKRVKKTGHIDVFWIRPPGG